MLIDRHTFHAFQEVVEKWGLELYQDEEKIIIEHEEGTIMIYGESGFIDHFSFPHNAKHADKIIEFAIFLSNEISCFPRSIFLLANSSTNQKKGEIHFV